MIYLLLTENLLGCIWSMMFRILYKPFLLFINLSGFKGGTCDNLPIQVSFCKGGTKLFSTV